MSTEYAHLNDSRPELIGGLNQVSNDNDNENKPPERIITVNENKFMNMSLSQIFSKIVNILPNMYNDYYKKHIETKVKMRSQNSNISESNVFRETMRSFIFENENMIYLGILILIIVFFLYIIN